MTTMETLPISSAFSPGPAQGASLIERHASFADALGRAAWGAAPADPAALARQGAEQLVANAFIRPLLAQLREGSGAAPPFAPTQGEKQFRSLADAKLADDIVRSARLPIVDRIANDLLRRTRGQPETDAGVGRLP
jgi:Rod binding domain-containing protein